MTRKYLIDKLTIAIQNLEEIDCLKYPKGLEEKKEDQKNIKNTYDILFDLKNEVQNKK